MPAKTPSRAKGLTYADSGVDLTTYDTYTESLPAMLRRTFGPRVIDNPGGFAGLFRLDYNERLFKRNYKDPVLVACTDGVGTKIKLAEQTGVLDTIGIDLVAMSVNDLIVQGAEPLFFLDYIAVGKVDDERLRAMVRGVVKGCEIAGCALIGGETAEMPGVYPPDGFDMAGFAVGVLELHRAINPLRVAPGDVVLGLASSGVHSNGYSLVRHVVEHARLDLGETYPGLIDERGEPETLGAALMRPTRIYAQPVVRLLRAYKVKKVVSGMSHITGGGLAQNLERSLGPNVDAVIDWDAWEPPAVFTLLQKKGGIKRDEMRRVFNCGIGYCLIVRPAFADSVADRLARQGERVARIGRIVKGQGRVRDASS